MFRICSFIFKLIILSSTFITPVFSKSLSCPDLSVLDRPHLDFVKDFAAENNGVSDQSDALQRAFICSSKLGRRLYLPAGSYRLKSTVFIEDKMHISGDGASTALLIESPIGLAIRDGDFANDVTVKNLTFRYQRRDSSPNDVALKLRSHSRSIFENLRFFGFNNQIIAELAPNYQGRPAQNIAFNTYSKWYIHRCRIGVIYEGLGQQDAIGPISVVSNNTWYDITFRSVKENAILAKSWVDTEKWYNLFAQASQDNAIIINLNPAPKWKQVDRFHFYSPVLVYASDIKRSAKQITGIYLGKGVNRVFMWGIVSDKKWPSPIYVDKGARSYHLVFGHKGLGHYVGPGVISKGLEINK